MTGPTKQAIEALRRLLDVSMVAMTDKDLETEETVAAWDAASEALAAYEAAQQARCDCGKKPAAECEKWEPGCHLGTDPEHAKAVRLDLQAGEQALPKETTPGGYNRPPNGEPCNPEDWSAGYEQGLADARAAQVAQDASKPPVQRSGA